MKPNQKTLKSEKTRRSIVNTFLHFYAKQPFEEITVKRVTEQLDINRGTFYLHYFDLDNLLTSIEDEHLDAIRAINEKNRSSYLAKDVTNLKQYYVSTLEYIGANKDVFRVLMSTSSRPRFRELFKEAMRDNAKAKNQMALGAQKWNNFNRYIVDVLVEGNMGIINNWVSEGNNSTVEEVAALFGDIMLNLPYSDLSR